MARAKERREFTYNALLEREGKLTVEAMMEILRSHRRKPFVPRKSSMGDICIHYKGTFTPTQTAASQVSILSGEGHIH